MIQLQPRRLLRPLTTPFDPDAYLSLVNPRWGTKLRGVVRSITPLTDDAASIRIRPGVSWTGHRPGQFVTVGVDVDGVRHHRCYSLTSTPGGRSVEIEITVQATDGGVVSNHLVQHTRPGDVVQLSQADGEFTLPARTDTPLLFVSGGSGLTPLMGMLRSLAQGPGIADVVLLHHATEQRRCLFRDELDLLAHTEPGLRIVTTYTRSTETDTRLSAARLDEVCPDWREREAYACGPEPLLDFVTSHWRHTGHDDRVHLERFVPASRRHDLPEHAGSSTAIARFARSDVDVLADDSTPLLDIAEDAGLAPLSGCRMGICHTCSTRLDQGCVRDLRDGRISGPGQHVQICVSAALDDVVLDL